MNANAGEHESTGDGAVRRAGGQPGALVPCRARVVHLELHTPDLRAAGAFYGELLSWPLEPVQSRCGTYNALLLGGGFDGGIVECCASRPGWIPYVEVQDLAGATERAQALGATVMLGPREGPSGWRSVISSPAGGELALWRQKR
jgi:predicted enzyme related to lactoylglutathione lyase